MARATLVSWARARRTGATAAMALPPSWIAVRSANYLLGGGDQAVCALVNYRLATNSCWTLFAGRRGAEPALEPRLRVGRLHLRPALPHPGGGR